MTEKQTRIFLWCWPRSISTAMEKCLSFVEGVQTWHEPYTVCLNSEMIGKGIAEGGGALGEMLQKYAAVLQDVKGKPNEFTGGKFMPVENFTYPFVKAKLEEEEPGKKYILVKDMAAAVLDHLDQLPDVPTRHTFIIRHPHRFLLSQRNMFMRLTNFQGDRDSFDMFTSSPVMPEGLYDRDAMHILWKHVQKTGVDRNPVIIDAEDVMNHPEKILPKYLEALGIPYHERYLTWDESEESLKTWKGALEQIVLGKRMGAFDKAFKSSCFKPNTHITPTEADLTPDIKRVVQHVLPGYQEMYENRIKPE